MNRINKLFNEKKQNILSLYFCAGHPTAGSTADIIRTLAARGIDMLEIGIPFSDPMADGPVIPFRDYMETFKPIADRHGLKIIMLITPETSEERIRLIDRHTDGFIYMVSSAATTGVQKEFDRTKKAYIDRVNQMGLTHPRMIGFGISNRQTLESAQKHAAGAIIGSRFVALLDQYGSATEALDHLREELKK